MLMKADYVIGVDVGGTNIKAGAVQYNGTVVAKRRTTTDAKLGAEWILDKIEKIILELQHDVHEGRLRAVGFGIPGAIYEGVVTQAPNIPAWEGLPIHRLLCDRLHLPCFIDNDANAVALGEMWMGAGRGYSHICCLTLGTGVGGGIIIDGELLHGADGMASEPGHMAVDANGARCNCGSYGCLETFASATGMKRMLREARAGNTRSSIFDLPENEITAEKIYEHAKQGDPVCREIVKKAAEGLGVALASLVNIFNPQILILGGGVAAASDLLIPPAVETMKRRAFRAMAERAKITTAQLGDDAGVLGCAYMAWDQLHQPERKRTLERSITPWGFWEVLEEGRDYKVKRIFVHPGHRLSYQKHQQREEIWMIASGEALIVIDGTEHRLQAGETIHIPKTSAHRVSNPGAEPLVFYETQRGTYFGEDDIVRLEDDYQRA